MNKKFLINAAETITSIGAILFRDGNFRNPYKKLHRERNNPVYILANGPSLSQFLAKAESDFSEYENADFFAVNEFVNTPAYLLIRPRYYVFSDMLYYSDTIYSERGHRTMRSLAERTEWEMTLFVPMIYKKSEYLAPLRENKNISIVYFHCHTAEGFECVTDYLYRKALCGGGSTVAIPAIYASLFMGYKDLRVYGIDHTFFDNIVVDDNNVVNFRETHFYKDERSVLRPLIYHDTTPARNITMKEYILARGDAFKRHERMQKLAQSMGAVIYNCTPGSLVDAYPRMKE